MLKAVQCTAVVRDAKVVEVSAHLAPNGQRQGFWSKTHGCVVQGVLQDLATPLGLRQRFVHDLHTAHPTDIMGTGVLTKPLAPSLV
jgi:hypothetical protein